MDSKQCLKCGGDVATGPGRTGKFCGRSCANSYNNSIQPKRRQVLPRCACGKVTQRASKTCNDCWADRNSQLTLGQLKEKAIRHAQVYNVLRQRSRRIAKSLGLTGCEVCGYDKHVEIAHIVALSKLPNETSVAEATGHNNFRLLCPNHHWEFDHNI